MHFISRIRFSLATIMMFVLATAAASALYAKILQRASTIAEPGWFFDVPTLFLLAIVLTALALGSWKSHSAVQIMLQTTLACLGCLTLIWIGEARYDRALRYWFQGCFAATVTIPLVARAIVKATLPRGPRRNWWKKTCEAVVFSFLNIILIAAGAAFQAFIIMYGAEFFGRP
jgi:hypothetical protein